MHEWLVNSPEQGSDNRCRARKRRGRKAAGAPFPPRLRCASDRRAKPEEECRSSEYVIFCCTRYGSHCAHLKSWWPYRYSWLDIVVPEFFRAILDRRDEHSSQGDASPQASRSSCPGLVRSEKGTTLQKIHHMPSPRKNLRPDLFPWYRLCLTGVSLHAGYHLSAARRQDIYTALKFGLPWQEATLYSRPRVPKSCRPSVVLRLCACAKLPMSGTWTWSVDSCF